MSFNEIINYQCEFCKKIVSEKPDKCSCEKIYTKGKIFGAFRLMEDKNSDDEIKVMCLLCNMTSKIHYSNLKRQKSCGCKPRHISIMGITDTSVKYSCRKCGNSSHVRIPILSYCCEEENE